MTMCHNVKNKLIVCKLSLILSKDIEKKRYTRKIAANDKIKIVEVVLSFDENKAK